MKNRFENAKTKQQIAFEYGICIKTFNKWLKDRNLNFPRGLITPKDQESIYKSLGFPNNSK
jgi:hypothetical protein